MGRRDHNTLAGRGDRDRHREVLIIAGIRHHGDENGADGGRIRHGGTGNTAKEHGGQDIHLSQTASHPSDACVCQSNEPTGNAALSHDLTGQNKEGDRQQGEGLNTVDHSLKQCS